MRQLCVCQQFNQIFLKSTPAPVKGAPGPLATFLRLFPLLVGLHRRLHLFRAKDPLDPCIVCLLYTSQLLRGVLAAFAGAFMDKDFLYKLVEHGICQRVKIFVLVNQGNKMCIRDR